MTEVADAAAIAALANHHSNDPVLTMRPAEFVVLLCDASGCLVNRRVRCNVEVAVRGVATAGAPVVELLDGGIARVTYVPTEAGRCRPFSHVLGSSCGSHRCLA